MIFQPIFLNKSLTSVVNPIGLTSTAIELVAERMTIKADGRSTTILTARVFNDRGAPIADGTRIQFSTTAGRLDTLVAETRGGVARVTLTAPEQDGLATVTANIESGIGAIPARVQIAFSNDIQANASVDRWMRVEHGSYIGYVTGIPGNPNRYIYAEDKTRKSTLHYQGITLTAQRLIIDTGRRLVIAENDVVVRQGSVERKYKHFRYDFSLGSGYGERLDDFRLRQVTVRAPLLQETILGADEPVMSRESWEFPDLSQAQITVVAGAIALDMETVLQFRNATFYVGGQKAFSARYHVMSPQQLSLYREQLFGVGATGMWLNFPYYYNVRQSGVGTLFLRRGGQFGSSVYSQRQGWTLDLDQTYTSRSGTEGLFQVLNVARSDRGYRLQHNQKFDRRTDFNFFADVVRGKDFFGSSQVSHSFPTFRLAVSAAANRYQGYIDTASGAKLPSSGDWRVQTTVETFPKLIAPKATVRYTLTGSHTDQRFFGSNNQRGPIQTDNAGTRLFANPIKLGHQTTLNQSGVVGYTWVKAPSNTTGIGASGPSYQTTTSLARPVRWRSSNLGNAQLSYDYVQTPPLFLTTTTTATVPGQLPSFVRQGRQRVSLSTYLNRDDRWGLSFTGSKGIDTTQSTVFSEGRVSLVGPWAARVRLTQTQVTGFGYRDWEYAFIRTVNNREVALYYSTIAKRFQLDLTGLSF